MLRPLMLRPRLDQSASPSPHRHILFPHIHACAGISSPKPTACSSPAEACRSWTWTQTLLGTRSFAPTLSYSLSFAQLSPTSTNGSTPLLAYTIFWRTLGSAWCARRRLPADIFWSWPRRLGRWISARLTRREKPWTSTSVRGKLEGYHMLIAAAGAVL